MHGTGSRVRLLLMAGLVLGAALLGAARADAADIAVKLTAGGTSAATRQRFEDALQRALMGTRYNVVPADKASHRLEVDLRQLGSDYTFRIRILESKSSFLLGDRDGRCSRCDETEATGQLELATESLCAATFENPEGLAPARPEAGRSGTTEPPSAWAGALPWVGLLGVLSASAAVHAHYRCQESGTAADACLVPLLGASSLAVLVGGLAVGTSASLALRDPTETERAPMRWAPWVLLTSGVVAGLSGAELLTEHGYGHGSLKALGYASVAGGALVAATAVGALLTTPRGRAGERTGIALHVSPTGVGLSARF